MAKPSGEGGWRKPHPTAVIETLIGSGIGSSFLPAATFLWDRAFHGEPPEWAKGAVPNVIAAAVLIPGFWLLARSANRWRERHRRKTPRAKGDRVAIYVAQFGDDDASREAEDSVTASLRGELGKSVEVLPAGKQFRRREGVSLDQQANEATVQARVLLKNKNGDLLIWGQLRTMDGKSVIELRFVSAAQDGAEGSRFGFTEKLMLEPGFGSEMGTALAAVAASMALPAWETSKYVVGILKPIASRLAPLVLSVPPSMAWRDRASLLDSFGSIQQSIGEQAGDTARLGEAVAAYREALKEYASECVPLNWATTQNNLGTALHSLGGLVSGTGRLEGAVAAHREALKVRTRERSPLDWAGTQNNLGNVLCSLGERESGTERLEEAVAAYREALKERTPEAAPYHHPRTLSNLAKTENLLAARKKPHHT